MGSLFFLVGAELGSATRDFATQNIVVTGSAQRLPSHESSRAGEAVKPVKLPEVISNKKENKHE